MKMNSQNFWQIFLETGAPEMYLLYNKAKKMEDIHVLDHQSIGSQNNSIQ